LDLQSESVNANGIPTRIAPCVSEGRRFKRGWEIGKTGGFSGKIIHKIWMFQATEGYS